jgi:hypothetical protein
MAATALDSHCLAAEGDSAADGVTAESMRGEGMSIEQAWQKAQDIWVALGRPVPCYDPAYLAAREELARCWRLRLFKA